MSHKVRKQPHLFFSCRGLDNRACPAQGQKIPHSGHFEPEREKRKKL